MLFHCLTHSLVQSVAKGAVLFPPCWQQLHPEVGFQVSQQRAFRLKFKCAVLPKPWFPQALEAAEGRRNLKVNRKQMVPGTCLCR